MSVLVDNQIRRLCEGRDNCAMIRPFYDYQLQPASYDVVMGRTLQIIDKSHLRPVDLRHPALLSDLYERVELAKDEPYSISPKGFVLSCTEEIVRIPPHVVGRIEGKSSLARVGLVMESAGYLDPGFNGRITLEIYNQLPMAVIIYPGMSIAQLSFETTTGRPDRLYGDTALGSHYQGDMEATGSRYGS